MSKIKFLSYANHRIDLDEVVHYWPYVVKTDRLGFVSNYGINFLLKNGAKVNAEGNDKISRNNVIKVLDAQFEVVTMSATKCDVCKYKEECPGNCGDLYDYKKFKRENPQQ